ncbi:unnamed protein product, partial [Laminaria digitata]
MGIVGRDCRSGLSAGNVGEMLFLLTQILLGRNRPAPTQRQERPKHGTRYSTRVSMPLGIFLGDREGYAPLAVVSRQWIRWRDVSCYRCRCRCRYCCRRRSRSSSSSSSSRLLTLLTTPPAPVIGGQRLRARWGRGGTPVVFCHLLLFMCSSGGI